MAQLVIVTGEQAGTRFRLQSRPLSAGRAPACEIQLLDVKVSRRHFMVVPMGGGYAVRELKSTNGVHVNAERIQGERVLADGDVIRAGDTQIVFSLDDNTDGDDAVRQFRRADKSLRDRSTRRSTGY